MILACGCDSKEKIRCHKCGRLFCPKHIYTRVDGNNRSITKNAPEYCAECYGIIYPDEVVSCNGGVNA